MRQIYYRTVQKMQSPDVLHEHRGRTPQAFPRLLSAPAIYQRVKYLHSLLWDKIAE